MNGLLSPALIALWTRQRPETIRTWIRRTGLLPAACDTRTRAGLYRMTEIPPAWHRRDTPDSSP